MRHVIAWSFVGAVSLVSGPVLAAEYYVAPNGNDTNAGSDAEPWASIAKANADLMPGDTVYLKAGEYGDPIEPARSGTAGQPITYANYPNEEPVLTDSSGGTAVVLDGREHIVVRGITADGKAIWDQANLVHWVSLIDARYNHIDGCTFRYARGWTGIELRDNSRHNRITGNDMSYVGTWDDGAGDDHGDMLSLECGASQNLVEGNVLRYGGHTPLVLRGAYRNVVRDNVIENDWTPTNGNRGAEITGDSSCSSPRGRNLVERNFFTKTLDPIDAASSAAVKVEGLNQLFRRNVIAACQAGISTSSRDVIGAADGNRIFHNVVYSIDHYGWRANLYAGGSSVDDNVLKNNIFFRTQLLDLTGPLGTTLVVEAPLGSNRIDHNLLVKDTPGDATIRIGGVGTDAVQQRQASYPDTFYDNLEQLPDFAVAAPQVMHDFELAATSPAIDAGEQLTTTTAAGSGTTVPVEDAGYFCDGFDIVDGDMVQIGSGTPVRVTATDYGAGTLTIAESRDWQAGDGVSLPYAGSGPDIGAFEHGLPQGGAGGTGAGGAGTGGAGAGQGGAGGASDGGSAVGASDGTEEDRSGCSCQLVGSASSSPWWFVLGLLLARLPTSRRGCRRCWEVVATEKARHTQVSLAYGR